MTAAECARARLECAMRQLGGISPKLARIALRDRSMVVASQVGLATMPHRHPTRARSPPDLGQPLHPPTPACTTHTTSPHFAREHGHVNAVGNETSCQPVGHRDRHGICRWKGKERSDARRLRGVQGHYQLLNRTPDPPPHRREGNTPSSPSETSFLGNEFPLSSYRPSKFTRYSGSPLLTSVKSPPPPRELVPRSRGGLVGRLYLSMYSVYV